MAEYRIKSTGEVKSQGQIRKLNPNTSLPKVWGANVFESLGIDPVLASPKPEASGEFKTVVRNGVEQDANGNWVYAWTERDMFSDVTYDEQRRIEDAEGNPVLDAEGNETFETVTVSKTKAEQEAEYQARKDAEAAKSVRTQRDNLLKETDWMGLSDVTMSAEMTTYRQALRDITEQEGFPYTIDWPTKPE